MAIDPSQIGDLYTRHFKQVYAYCRRRTSIDRVDDAVSETFLVAHRRASEVPDDDGVLPWLFGVAYRVMSNQWRATRRRYRLEERLKALGVDPLTVSDEYVVARFESELVVAALDRLKGSDREVLRLAYWEEMSHQSIAVALDISPGAAKQRVYEARKRLTREFNRLEASGLKTPAAREGGGL